MSAIRLDVPPELKRVGTRIGYGVAVIVNLAMLIVVNNLLEWGWLPFLTEDFAGLVPWISLSLIVSIVANFIYQFDDTTVVNSTGQILVSLVSVVVTYRVLSVFPFDFSAWEFDWALLTRVLLILAMVGGGVAVISEAVKLTKTLEGLD